MRTLDATLDTALNGATYQPYFSLEYAEDNGLTFFPHDQQIVSYELGKLNLKVVTHDAAVNWYAIRIKRGVLINGTPNITTSSIYYVNEGNQTDDRKTTIQGSILPRKTFKTYSAAGDDTYENIITALCAAFGYTATFEAGAWRSYQFYPTGRTLTLQSPHSIFTVLRQKYFIYAQDDNDNHIYFSKMLDDGSVGIISHPPLETIKTFHNVLQYSNQKRKLIWRDEANTVHTDGNATDPIHNLGFLASTASSPDVKTAWHKEIANRTWHLKYQRGDIIQTTHGTFQIDPSEIFNPKESPTLYLKLDALEKFTNTEGGALPSTIEAAAPYTPLVTGTFNGILSANDNNIQAAMETIDDHTHAGSGVPIDAPTATNNFLIGAQVASVWTWVRNTLAQTITVLRASLDSIYAPIAKGVTNGDSHDHNGGDGAQIDHANLANIGTNTHTQIDTHITRNEFPFASYLTALPLTADGYPNIMMVGNPFTATSFVIGVNVTANNSSSNYWTINVQDLSGTTICVLDTKTATSANTWYRLTTSSFTHSDMTTTRKGAYVYAVKTGTPGNLYVAEPKFTGTYT